MVISIGEFIKFFRKRHKLTQQQLADILEITPKGLIKIEKGLSSPRAYTIRLFEDYFKVKTSRYYHSTADTIPLASHEIMWDMLMCTASGNYKKAYKLACQFEDDFELTKNNDCYINIYYTKARFFADYCDNLSEALKYYLQGIQYEDYVYFDKSDGTLVIESFMPSIFSLQLIGNLAECLHKLGKIAEAVQVTECAYSALRKLDNLPLLVNFFYSKEDVLYPSSLLENLLAELYYKQGRFEDALNAVEDSLSNQTVFGALHLGDKSLLKFKALCSLDRFAEATSVLPDVLFYNKQQLDETALELLIAELCKDFQVMAKQIKAFSSMFDTMYSMHSGQ